MLGRIFESGQTYWDVEEGFTPQNFRFFESVILGWKDKTLQTWGIDTLKEKFKAELLRQEMKRKSSLFKSVLGYFNSNKAGLESSRMETLQVHFNEFDGLFQEEQNRLFHSSDTSLELKIGLTQICITDGADRVELNIHGASLTVQTNECFMNYEFTIKSIDGSEINATRCGSNWANQRNFVNEDVPVGRGIAGEFVHSEHGHLGSKSWDFAVEFDGYQPETVRQLQTNSDRPVQWFPVGETDVEFAAPEEA